MFHQAGIQWGRRGRLSSQRKTTIFNDIRDVNMLNPNEIKRELLQRLSHLNLKQVVVFGSHAHGLANEDSDIDVYVVTRDRFIPQNYKEKRELVRKVSRPLADLRQKVSLDLLVHTEPMNTKFYDLNSSLARDIQEKGIRLL